MIVHKADSSATASCLLLKWYKEGNWCTKTLLLWCSFPQMEVCLFCAPSFMLETLDGSLNGDSEAVLYKNTYRQNKGKWTKWLRLWRLVFCTLPYKHTYFKQNQQFCGLNLTKKALFCLDSQCCKPKASGPNVHMCWMRTCCFLSATDIFIHQQRCTCWSTSSAKLQNKTVSPLHRPPESTDKLNFRL